MFSNMKQSDEITRIPYTDQENPVVKEYVQAVERGLQKEIDENIQSAPMPPLGEVAPHEQLLKALYWVYDFMDRALINFFLVGKTAEAVLAKKDLFGDKITVGVRKLEWESGARRIVDSFVTPIKEEKYTVEYEYERIPVILYVLEDDATIQSTDQQMYKSEFFKLPNPYEEFRKVYPWVN